MKDTERIYRTVLYYMQNDGEKDIETNVVDMLADLMHYSDEYGIDFNSALSSAESHYTEEKDEATHATTRTT